MDTSSEEETVDDQQLHPDYEDGALSLVEGYGGAMLIDLNNGHVIH